MLYFGVWYDLATYVLTVSDLLGIKLTLTCFVICVNLIIGFITYYLLYTLVRLLKRPWPFI